jgi:hypothetical protein
MGYSSINDRQVITVDWAKTETLVSGTVIPIDDTSFPLGTRALFVQSTAPAGWTKETSANYNNAVAVIREAINFGSGHSGGAGVFFPTHTHTTNNHSHTHQHRHVLYTAAFQSHKHAFGSPTTVPSGGLSSMANTITDVSDTNLADDGTLYNFATLSGTFTTGAANIKYYSLIIATKTS